MNDPIIGYGLVVLGLLLLASEMLLPTMGVLFVLALVALIAGIAMVFKADSTQGMVTVLAVLVIIPVAGPILLRYLPRTALGRKYFLLAADEDDTLANMPVNLELEQLRGRYGKTVSALRPAGTTEFDGRRVDTLSEGDMIEPGKWVKCMDVRAGKVVVRQVDKPPEMGSFEDDDFRPPV